MATQKDQFTFISIAKQQFTETELNWLDDKIDNLTDIENSKKFPVFFSLASRFVKEKSCNWDADDLEQLELVYPGFRKTTWTNLLLARVLLMLQLDISINKQIIVSFFETAEIKEQIALYKGLFLLENAVEFTHQATEGIRTNVVDIFDAIAHGNPFMSRYLNEEAWNQLILKCFFMDRKIYRVQNIDQRKNKALATMLQNYVEERWAAGRHIPMEAWRLIDGYLKEGIQKNMATKKVVDIEKELFDNIQNDTFVFTEAYWNYIGKNENR